MEFEISVTLANKLLAAISPECPLAQRLSEHGLTYGKIVVPSWLLDPPSQQILYGLAREEKNRALMFQLIALRNILNDQERLVVPYLDMLVPALVSYIMRDAIDGWLYKRNKDGVLLPWLVHRIDYVEPAADGVGRPFVILRLLANTIQSACKLQSDDPDKWRSGMTNAIVFTVRDIGKLSIPELLARHGFYKECPEFKADYEMQSMRFLELQPRFGKQFVAKNSAFLINGSAFVDDELEFFRFKDGVTAKCVNDEEVLERRFETNTDRDFWQEHSLELSLDKIPLHCYMHMFHLEYHRNIWVHVQNLEEYKYKPELRDKLILPTEHRDLIDILTSNMDVLMDDIVEGKSGGTTILCMGASGLGKTLTAEVYSEVVGKPLYRVHSGQLGISAVSVEATLTTILRRAARWDSILLLDEADVYIRCRDNDLQHNAIVAEFLRTLEYFNGLLFMTTNRVDDVDDAILSRCIAVIKYEVPPRAAAMRIWQSLSTQFQTNLDDALITALVDAFPQASGRDIKELLKLTTRYCQSKKIPYSLAAFRQCAIFRGEIT